MTGIRVFYGMCSNTFVSHFKYVTVLLHFRIIYLSWTRAVSIYPSSLALEDADKGISMATIDPAALPTDPFPIFPVFLARVFSPRFFYFDISSVLFFYINERPH